MSDAVYRYIRGDFDKVYLGTPRTHRRQNGDTWQNYSVRVTNGFYVDTNERVTDRYFNSNYPVRVFNGEEQEPVDAHEYDGKKIRGSLLVKEITHDDGKISEYLNAVQVVSIEGADSSTESTGNPFTDMPLA